MGYERSGRVFRFDFPFDFGFCGSALMGRGGSRIGAGRPGWHTKAEHCLRLDVRRLQKAGAFSGTGLMTWGWQREGRQIASIVVRHFGREALRLEYMHGEQVANQTIGVEYMPCHFGGERAWFACPRCAGRCAILYMKGGRFACRKCQRLVYASQSEDACARSWRGQQKLERKLGPDWERPKGMHEKTREKLLDRIFYYEQVRDNALAAYVNRLFGSRAKCEAEALGL